MNYLIASAGILLILCGGNFFRVRNRWFYIFWGVIMWYLFLQSGIHATIAGVVAAFTVPATPHYKIGKYINRIRENIAVFPASDKESVVLSKMQINVLKSIESSSDRVISPLQSLEDSLHGMVNYIILPLFAFANAGVSLTADHGGLEVGMATWAVLAGLLAGKFAGIYFFTWLVIKMGVRRTAERHDLGEPDRYLSFGRYRFYGFFVYSQPLFRGFAGVADAGKDGCHTGNGAGGCAGVSGLAVRPA